MAELARIAALLVVVAWTWLEPWRPLPNVDIVGIVATLVGGYPIFQEAAAAMAKRRMTMELSMTVAIVAALVIGETFTALVIVVFVLIAEVLEHLTIEKGRGAIKDLLTLLPREATVRRPHGDETIDVEIVKLDEIVIVKPGSRLPVDGVVVAGQSFVDEAAITGESMPAEKAPGARVYAGTINQSGMLEVRRRPARRS